MSRDARRAREFESFVAGAAGRLLHAATLLTAEPAASNPRARRLLTAALAHTYATWHNLRGEDPYERTRQQLALRFARAAWHRHRGHTGWHAPWSALRHTLGHALHAGRGEPSAHFGAARPGGVLDRLTPQERLILVLRMYEGVAEEQTAALLGLPTDRVRVICARAMSMALRPRPVASGPGRYPQPTRAGSLPKVGPS